MIPIAALSFSVQGRTVQGRCSRRCEERRIRTLRWRALLVVGAVALRPPLEVGVVALRPLRPRRAAGPSHYRLVADEACAPLCAARRLAARAVPPRRAS